jgi:hypothetical protein
MGTAQVDGQEKRFHAFAPIHDLDRDMFCTFQRLLYLHWTPLHIRQRCHRSYPRAMNTSAPTVHWRIHYSLVFRCTQ